MASKKNEIKEETAYQIPANVVGVYCDGLQAAIGETCLKVDFFQRPVFYANMDLTSPEAVSSHIIQLRIPYTALEGMVDVLKRGIELRKEADATKHQD